MAVYVWQTANCKTVRNQAFMRIFVLHVNSDIFQPLLPVLTIYSCATSPTISDIASAP